MNDFKKKVIKYTVLVIGTICLNSLSAMFMIPLMDIIHFDFGEKIFKLLYAIPSFIINILFGIILFYDCRKEIRHYYSIPILGAISPVFGVMFYFIESFLLNQNNSHD